MKNLIFGILRLIKTEKLNFWERYMEAYGRSVKDGYKANAFSPLAWFVIFLVPVLIVLLIITKSEVVQYFTMGLLAIIILFPLVMYVVLVIKNPKLLQSEKFRIEDRKIDLIAEKGGEIKILPYDLADSQLADKLKDVDG